MNSRRKLDLCLRRCDNGDPVDSDCSDETDLSFLPQDIFKAGDRGDGHWNYTKMEYARVSIYPYEYQDDIPFYGFDFVYPMALRIAIAREDFRINLASRVVAGDYAQGVLCADNETATSTDVNVWVWPDSDYDGVADGYTVTTGTFTFDEDNRPISLHPGPMRAAICSNDGPLDCTDASDAWCNYLGQVEIQFTIYMQNK